MITRFLSGFVGKIPCDLRTVVTISNGHDKLLRDPISNRSSVERYAKRRQKMLLDVLLCLRIDGFPVPAMPLVCGQPETG